MKQSESIAALSKALVLAQAEMGGAVKDSANPFFKSKYADLTSVVKAVKEPFAKHGLAYTQLPIRAENGIGVVTRLIHESGEWLEEEFTLPMVKQDPQAAGAAITYARRYALQALAGIPTADDDAESAMLRGVISEPESPEIAETEQMIEAGVQLNDCFEQDDYLGAAQVYDEWSHEEHMLICRAPSKGGQISTANRVKLKSTEFRLALNQVRGITEAA